MSTAAPARSLPAGDGVTFPLSGDRRATTPTGRAILADAARAASLDLAERIEAARDWRGGYAAFVRELTERSGDSAEAALAIAETGLASMRARLVLERDGAELPLHAVLEPADAHFGSEVIEGAGPRVSELRVPYRGGVLRGDALRRRLDAWVEAGVMEPSACVAIRRVMEHPEWLRLAGRRIALVGAGSEVGPLEPLTTWGADVLAIDLPEAAGRITEIAARGAGSVTLPAGPDGARGADLVRALPELRAWLGEAAGDDDDLVLGMYAYADGGAHVRVSAAFDALATDLLEARPGTALAYLATPTDAFLVPDRIVTAARVAWEERSGKRRAAQAPLRALSGGRLFSRAYAAGDVADILVAQQGPNYALAKRLQRWRGVTAAAAGHPVSFNVAPSAWTRSVTSNRVLAAAYAGAHRFGIEIFAPETSRVLMAALLVHDLYQQSDLERHPEALFSDGAVHGGLWRSAYEPRSVLGVAALTGLVRGTKTV